ncbi:response regulator receiver domain-containing protein [Larkinella arboricola]|uniref:Response regulator receiver domain-containing protein n=1 Tax=Larkinella arboricola TaxID=643671 RepID=A0A327WIK7_LARAB|nr:response regulator [Larkinella arboricola]RAJ90870.1 response regulator receiver domain-containing protein [Larkinella arboricola]
MHTGSKKLVFIVDDDDDDCTILLIAFSKVRPDCQLECYTRGREVVNRLMQKNAPIPNLILLDLLMPQMDGLLLLQQIRSNPALNQVPVVIFTQANSNGRMVECYQAGSSSYIRKPGSFEELARLIEVTSSYWLDTVRIAGIGQ